jgi:predicted small lipoprotein YifL
MRNRRREPTHSFTGLPVITSENILIAGLTIMPIRIQPLVVIILSILVAACGQKGPLYLPGNPSEIRSEIPRQVGTQEEDEDQQDQQDDQVEQ